MHRKVDSDKEELVSIPPPPYGAPPYEASNTSLQQQQQLTPTIIVNNTTVIHQNPLISDSTQFCSDTPRTCRRIFIRCLFLVITAQFLLIDGIIAMLIFVPFFHEKMLDKRNTAQFYIIWIISIVALAIISSWERVRRIPPANYVTIILFTIFQGITLGCAATFKVMSMALLTSVGTTGVVCLTIAMFELQGRYHLGNFRSLLYVWTMNAVCFGITLSFLNYTEASIAAGLSTLFCTYLVVNVQMMVHGTTRYILTPKEFVFGAMNIYGDIVHGIIVSLGILICSCGCCKVCASESVTCPRV